ncbi:hypothetical protein HHO41_21450 [Bacillus sp. DNRA2]|uniref:hypothetical protein n=1 Tax=Bacillus sp. DNRA2 TaxID=2723053 RepID=UPI00145F1125|nr:hypothetical protein [Bacillus sp. DNRA2]NMD72791.1 hypothetical protein [Bacillus sp. DNRA2]
MGDFLWNILIISIAIIGLVILIKITDLTTALKLSALIGSIIIVTYLDDWNNPGPAKPARSLTDSEIDYLVEQKKEAMEQAERDKHYVPEPPITETPNNPGYHSVKGYYRSDGTYVRPYIRSNPDGSTLNNLNP